MPQSEGAIFSVVLLAPILVYYLLFKKHWVDVDLRRSFISGLVGGLVAIVVTRLVYVPVEIFLGTDLRSFISGPRSWWVTLLTSIGIIGFVEESLKAAGGLVAGYQVEYMRRPTVLFMGFAGCALSFSMLENVQYYIVFGPTVVIPRIIISSTAHLFFACLCAGISAAALSRKKTDYVVSARILGGISAAALAHGLFDFVVFHFDIQALSGIIVSVIALFLLGIYETWLAVLKMDIPDEAKLTTCSGCGAFSLDLVRFCGFCGSRVLCIRKNDSLKVSENKEP